MNVPPIIGFVTTTQDDVNHARTLATQKGCRLVIAQCCLEDALEPAQRMVSCEGAEVILSRRGTACMLRDYVDVPVISLPENLTSLIHAVKKALLVGSNVGITLFQTIKSDIALCEELLGTHLDIITYTGKKTLEAGVRSAKKRGVDVVIGGGATLCAAEKYDITFVPLHEYDILSEAVFDNVLNIISTRRQHIEKNERYHTILNGVSDGIIAVDAMGMVNEANDRASSLLHLESQDIIGMNIKKIFNDDELLQTYSSGQNGSRVIITSRKDRLLVKSFSMRTGSDRKVIGAVYSIQSAAQILQAKESVRISYNKDFLARYQLKDFIHRDKKMVEILDRVRLYAATDATLLITGESGTGKEILAQGVHMSSPRHAGPFVSINCSGMPEQLLESELFGYVEGAFTGSRRSGKVGLFELAKGGTVFLDEIGSIPMSFQTRLLRVLQEKEVMRIGSNVLTPVDMRVIAASNRNLEHEVQAGRLREDLYFRLNVLAVNIPPLRERGNDVALIFESFLKEAVKRHSHPTFRVPAACIERLCCFSWPGNVRQLQSFVEHLVTLTPREFDPHVFSRLVDALEQSMLRPAPAVSIASSHAARRKEVQPLLTPEQIRTALISSGNNKGYTAKILGVSRTTLWRMLRRWDISLDL